MAARTHRLVSALLVLVVLLAGATSAFAQGDEDAPREPVTQDDVNAIASQLFCPVCEHLPLNVCPEPTCIQWRAEIREQLEAGRSSDEIIDYFVSEYGDRVVGLPQNPLLRALSLVGPLAVIIIGLGMGGLTFLRWRNKSDDEPDGIADVRDSAQSKGDDSDADYRARLEDDLGYKS